ncbi:hypothetical protein BSK71_04540 [Pectobacterium actinidiae]|uniref:Uncharacterized protein n=1 Tax=Pectobacterium actinidiae TaxID=1507808 RepID=A0A1V2R823_9GAMM|nr:hypothetical protein BSK69_10465 [Pectobacterium actinidiae]ONK08501.1 hypothetical protein BSK71_04540 [Pectobacterium actinidiae]
MAIPVILQVACALAALFGLMASPLRVSASAVQERFAVFVLKLELFRVYIFISPLRQEIIGFAR